MVMTFNESVEAIMKIVQGMNSTERRVFFDLIQTKRHEWLVTKRVSLGDRLMDHPGVLPRQTP